MNSFLRHSLLEQAQEMPRSIASASPADHAGSNVVSTSLDQEAIEAFAPDAKIAMLATLDEDGLPHLTLLTSLDAHGPHELTFGQFSEGLSKEHLRRDPRAAFLVMTMDRRLWRGKARWTREAKTGEEHEAYNRRPMFRYNAYFGIHTVHYLDLLEVAGPTRPDTAAILGGVVANVLLWRGVAERGGERILSTWAERHLASPRTLKFLAYVGDDGFPAIVPLVPCRSAGSRRLVLAGRIDDQGLADLAAGSPCAVHGLNLAMESVMVRGRLSTWTRTFGIPHATMEIDLVYNSMPPNHGVVYPAAAG